MRPVMSTVTTISAAALAACALVLAPTARADQIDYVSYLDDNGVAYRSMSGVIALGKEDVCHPLRSGMSVDSVIGAVVDYGYTGQETAYIIVGAIQFMCPDQMATLQDWRNHRPPAERPPADQTSAGGGTMI